MFRWINKQLGIQSFETNTATIKISIMTEYHQLINPKAHGLF